MTNEDREFAEFMLKFHNKTRELKEDFDKYRKTIRKSLISWQKKMLP